MSSQCMEFYLILDELSGLELSDGIGNCQRTEPWNTPVLRG